MKREEFLPFLNKFVTVVLNDGSERSGYIANPDDFKTKEDDDIELILLNGLYTENVKIADIESIGRNTREDTVALPVIDLTDGYDSHEDSK